VPAIFDQLPGFLEIGAWTTRHIRPLFDLFRDENVAPALASIIFGSALMLCIFFLIDSSFIRAQVRRRIQAVRSIKGKIEFAEAMPNIERLMLGTRYLRHSWQKFRETLIEPSGDEERNSKVVLNTARPQDYFNTAEAGLRFPLYRAMPNLLVGIGLLLTFFGLVGVPDDGAARGRQSRVVLAPRRWCQVREAIRGRRWLTSPAHRGDHGVTVKTIAQGMPGQSGEPVATTLVCLLTTLHTRLRVHWAEVRQLHASNERCLPLHLLYPGSPSTAVR
jgi:hypothetical protein